MPKYCRRNNVEISVSGIMSRIYLWTKKDYLNVSELLVTAVGVTIAKTSFIKNVTICEIFLFLTNDLINNPSCFWVWGKSSFDLTNDNFSRNKKQKTKNKIQILLFRKYSIISSLEFMQKVIDTQHIIFKITNYLQDRWFSRI